MNERVLDGLCITIYGHVFLIRMFLQAFHDGLDFIAVQEKLFNGFQDVLAGGKQKQSLDGQVDTIVRAKASKFKDGDWRGLLEVGPYIGGVHWLTVVPRSSKMQSDMCCRGKCCRSRTLWTS